MTQALWIAKTGLDAQQTRMAVVSNNLANVNTTGFKQGRAVFEDLLYQNVRQAGGSSSQDTILPTGMSLGTGAVGGPDLAGATAGGVTDDARRDAVPAAPGAGRRLRRSAGGTAGSAPEHGVGGRPAPTPDRHRLARGAA